MRHTTERDRVAFGLRALTTALKAKTGQLRVVDQRDLLVALVEHVPSDENARTAVVGFVRLAQERPFEAGQALADWLSLWQPELPISATKQVLEHIANAAPDWALRKDCGHD